MAFLTKADLSRGQQFTEVRAQAGRYHTKTAASTLYIFLSHSHKDKDVVLAAASYLGKYVDHVYVDWADDTMPEKTDAVTALRIQMKIRECHKFVFLGTDNGCASRWCPWELGVGDVAKGHDNVLVMPVTDPPHTWQGNEYIQVYYYLEKDSLGNPYVVHPITKAWTKLADWMSKK